MFIFTWEDVRGVLAAAGVRLEPGSWLISGPEPSHNAAPGRPIPALRDRGVGVEPGLLMWSMPRRLVSGRAVINARSETAATKPMFRDAMARRRCVLPVSGFYEWRAGVGGERLSYYISRRDGAPMFLAGLWDRATGDAGGDAEGCVIITTTPNAVVAPIHDRMPCVLEPGEVGVWCDPSRSEPGEAATLLRPACDETLCAHRVHRRVGSVRVDDPTLIEPAPEADEQGSLFSPGGAAGD